MKHYELYVKSHVADSGDVIVALEATAYADGGVLGTWLAASAATTAQIEAGDDWGNALAVVGAADAAMGALKQLAAPWASARELAVDIVPPLEGSPFAAELERWALAQEADLAPDAVFWLEDAGSESVALCAGCFGVAGDDGPAYSAHPRSEAQGITCQGCGRRI